MGLREAALYQRLELAIPAKNRRFSTHRKRERESEKSHPPGKAGTHVVSALEGVETQVGRAGKQAKHAAESSLMEVFLQKWKSAKESCR